MLIYQKYQTNNKCNWSIRLLLVIFKTDIDINMPKISESDEPAIGINNFEQFYDGILYECTLELREIIGEISKGFFICLINMAI